MGPRQGILLFHCTFTKPRLIWLRPGGDVPCGISNIAGTISRHSLTSPNVVSAVVTASSSVCNRTKAGTLNSDVTYILSVPGKWLATSSHPGCVNSSHFIFFCRYLSMRCNTHLLSVPFTQPGLSSSLSLAGFVSSSSSSSLSTPWSEHARSLRLSPIATIIPWKVFLCSLIVNPSFSAFFISSYSCWTAPSGSSTRFLAPVDSLPNNPHSIPLSHHCFQSAFPGESRLDAFYWIASCAISQALRLLLPPIHCCLHWLHEVVGWTA